MKETTLTRFKGLFGDRTYKFIVSNAEDSYLKKRGAGPPSGEMELELYNAFMDVMKAEAVLAPLQAELQKAEAIWNNPWEMSRRLKEYCDGLWDTVAPLTQSLSQGTSVVRKESSVGSNGAESKECPEPLTSSKQEGPTFEALAANPSIMETLSLYLPSRKLKSRAAQAVALLQQNAQKCQAAMEEAQRRYESKRREVADVTENEGMAETFEAAACCGAGAVDARPMVRQLHEAWRGLEEAKAAAQAAAQQLVARKRHLCTMGSVLERLSASVEGLVRVYPATLAVLIGSCQGAAKSLESQLKVAPAEAVGSDGASSSLPVLSDTRSEARSYGLGRSHTRAYTQI